MEVSQQHGSSSGGSALARRLHAIRSTLLPKGAGSVRLPSGPLLTIVWPCFGQNCIESLMGSSR